MILSAIQEIQQQPVMEDFALKLIVALIGLIGTIGAAYYLMVSANAKQTAAQASLTAAQAKERQVGTEAQEDVYQQLQANYDRLEKDFQAYKQERTQLRNEDQKKIADLVDLQNAMKDQQAEFQKQVNELSGANDALLKTSQILSKDNIQIATDYGVATESKRQIAAELDTLKTERAQLLSERDDCNKERAQERDAYNVQIGVMTERIAALELQLAEKNVPENALPEIPEGVEPPKPLTLIASAESSAGEVSSSEPVAPENQEAKP